MFCQQNFFLTNKRILLSRFYTSSISNLIELKNATIYRYGKKEPAFEQLSLTIQRNQRWVIVGPVNAGKTTLAEVSMLQYKHIL